MIYTLDMIFYIVYIFETLYYIVYTLYKVYTFFTRYSLLNISPIQFSIILVNESEAAKPSKQAICFDFDDDYEPLVFGKSKKKENKENQLPKLTLTKQSSKENGHLVTINSPKTPQNLRQREILCNSTEISKSNPKHMKCISNSPLLKLAMISSHGKRQSLSTNSTIRINNNGNGSFVQPENFWRPFLIIDRTQFKHWSKKSASFEFCCFKSFKCVCKNSDSYK